jgi:hypothetical protein
MKKELMFIICLALMLVPMVSAVNIGTFKLGTNVEITNYCASGTCTYANLSSVKYPDSSMIYINEAMTKTGINFNYTFTGANQIGEYTFVTCGNPDGVVYCDSDTFTVTPNGFVNSPLFYIIIFLIAIGLIVLGYSVQDYWLIVLGGFVLILFGLYILVYGLAGMKDTVYTWGIGIIVIMVGAYFGIRAAWETIGE